MEGEAQGLCLACTRPSAPGSMVTILPEVVGTPQQDASQVLARCLLTCGRAGRAGQSPLLLLLLLGQVAESGTFDESHEPFQGCQNHQNHSGRVAGVGFAECLT
jgi:hypothetical protein